MAELKSESDRPPTATIPDGLPRISAVQNYSILSQNSDGTRSARTPLMGSGRAILEAAALSSGGFSFSFRGTGGALGSGPLAASTDSPNRAGDSPLLSNASVVALGPSCAMYSPLLTDRRSGGSGGGTPRVTRAAAPAFQPQFSNTSLTKALSTSPIPLEPTDILEVNKSLNRSFHATPVIESQNIDKVTLVHKRQKLLNDKYILYPRQELGRGSYGKVVLCYSLEDHAHFAAKIFQRNFLRKVGLGANSALLRIHVELEILKRLRHDNIIALHEFIDDGVSPKLYMIFELAAYGEVLKMTPQGQLAEGEEPLPEREVRRVVDSVVKALSFAHERGVAHRDVKPENILITSTHAVKLADFGAAIADVADGDTVNRGGSVAFLPPELLAKEMVLSRATSNVSRILPRAASSRGSAVWKTTLSLEGPQSFPRSQGLSSQPLLDHIECADDSSFITSLHTPGTVSYRTDSSLGNQFRQISSISATSSNAWVAPNTSSSGVFHPGFELPSVRPTEPHPHGDAGPLSAESSMSMQAFTSEDTPLRGGATSSAGIVVGNLVDFFKADVWSLGITTFFLLFGKLPWKRARDGTSLSEDILDHPDPFYEILNNSLCDSDDDDNTTHSNSPMEPPLGVSTPTKGPDELFEDLDRTSRPLLVSTAVPHGESFSGASRTSTQLFRHGSCANHVVQTPDNHSLPSISVQNASWAGSLVTLERTESQTVDDPKYLGSRKKSDPSSARRNRRRTPRSIESLGVSSVCIDFIRQCLSTDPHHRPTARELEDHMWFQQQPTQRRETQLPDPDVMPTFSVPPPLIASPYKETSSTKETAQVSVRVLAHGEERDVPSDLQELLKAKIGPSNKRLIPLTFFDASPPTLSLQDPSIGSSTGWSSPNSQFVSPILGMGSALLVPGQRRSKDDSVIFTAFPSTQQPTARRDSTRPSNSVVSGDGNQNPTTPKKHNSVVTPGVTLRHVDCVAIEASGATPYGQRASWSANALWSGGFAQPTLNNFIGDKVRSPSSPNKSGKGAMMVQQHPPAAEGLSKDSGGAGVNSTRRITLRDLVQESNEGPVTSDMKHVSSGPL